MRRAAILVLLAVFVMPLAATAQETYFGKNKVRYKEFEWSYIQTRRFDIHFYEESYDVAKFAAEVLESSYDEVTRELNYKLQRRVPIFIYNSHNDFQQTNITPSLISEATGGFTEAFKNRIVIPFSGSYEDFRHVLHHELTHAIVFDMIYGNMFSSLLSKQRLFSVPLWFAEGYAEYSSRHGWDYQSDMYVRDATVNSYLAPPDYIGGFLAYKQGQAMVKYIAETYGEDKLGLILQKGRVHLSMSRAIKEALGVSQEKFWKDFNKEMKRRYWPELADRKTADEIGNQLTKAREDGSFFNEKPTFSPNGATIAIFTDKSDYTEIVLISAKDGEVIKKLVQSQRSADLESLHSFVSGVSFSPDGRKIVFVAKSNGKDALIVYDLDKNHIAVRKRYKFENIISPAWSPDGQKIAFSALAGVQRDIYVWNVQNEQTIQITNDVYDDVEPSWLPDSESLIYSSDSPHPRNPDFDQEGASNLYTTPKAYRPGGFNYGFYNLFTVDMSKREAIPLDVGPGENTVPRVSPDGKKVAFISNRNGIDNIYIAYLDSSKVFAVTDILTGVTHISWSPDGQKIAFSAFGNAAFNVYVLEDLVPVGNDGTLVATAYVKGDYNKLKLPGDTKELAVSAVPPEDSLANDSGYLAEEYSAYPVKPETVATADSSAVADTSSADKVDETAAKEEDDEVISETGIYDGEYVYVSGRKTDPLDSMLISVGDSLGGRRLPMEEPLSFDSIPPPSAAGDFKVKDYKAKLTPDYIGGGFAYDTFFGLRGQTFFLLSDHLGNHQIFIATDLVNTIDQSNVQAYYFYSRMRTQLGVGIFHTKNFYIDSDDFLFSDRFYGFQLLASRPFSTFSRVEFTGSQYFIDREYLDFLDFRDNRNSKVSTADVSYVFDNILWGFTGPINGRRMKASVSGGVNLFDSNDISFTAVDLDYRKYWHFGENYSFAFRMAAGGSFGSTPKLYFLGGTTNYIGNRTVDAEVFEVENLYFADVITPLRGYDYYELEGNRYALANLEFRFPMIEYFAMRFPLPITLSRVIGAMFIDIGSAWTNSDFKGGTTEGGRKRLQDIKTGFGVGLRANLGFVLLRYDVAWNTDFYNVGPHAEHYFSFGADF